VQTVDIDAEERSASRGLCQMVRATKPKIQWPKFEHIKEGPVGAVYTRSTLNVSR